MSLVVSPATTILPFGWIATAFAPLLSRKLVVWKPNVGSSEPLRLKRAIAKSSPPW